MSETQLRLTKRGIDALTPKTRDYVIWDLNLERFGVRVWPSGRKVFIVQYRTGGRSRKLTLGNYGALTLEQARRLAREHLGEVAAGKDPAKRLRDDRRTPTVATISERFLTEHVAVRCKSSTAKEYRRAVERFILPAFGSHRVSDITRADVAELHHTHRHIPYQANRTLGVLSKMFNLAEVWGFRRDGSNPCRHITKYKERKRERYLNAEELRRLFETLDRVEQDGSESPAAVAAFRLLAVTGCRLREIQTLRWECIELSHIVLPDSKTGPRKVPTTPAVQSILDGIVRNEHQPWVIAGTQPGSHLTDLQKPWRRIRKQAGLDDVRIHDLRHTYASLLVEQGQSLEVVGKLLGHTQYQTTMRYAHLADDPLRRAADQVSSVLSVGCAPKSSMVRASGAVLPLHPPSDGAPPSA